VVLAGVVLARYRRAAIDGVVGAMVEVCLRLFRCCATDGLASGR
jgi:hypothetical protein